MQKKTNTRARRGSTRGRCAEAAAESGLAAVRSFEPDPILRGDQYQLFATARKTRVVVPSYTRTPVVDDGVPLSQWKASPPSDYVGLFFVDHVDTASCPSFASRFGDPLSALEVATRWALQVDHGFVRVFGAFKGGRRSVLACYDCVGGAE